MSFWDVEDKKLNMEWRSGVKEAGSEALEAVATRILQRHKKAFEELAKEIIFRANISMGG